MTTASALKNHRSLPRKKRTPSLRDQAIFLAYRTQGRSQAELAKDNKLSQSRIGQILRRVQRWAANLAPSSVPSSTLNLEPGTLNSLSAAEHRRLEWLLCRERSQSLFDRSIRAFDREKDSLKTLREGHRDNKPFQETVTREVNTSAQLLRVAQRANSDLLKLALTEPPPQPQPEADERLLERLMFERLYQDRQQAEDENKVAKSTTDLESFQVVDRWYAALIGDQDYLPIHPADLEPTEPLSQLAQFFHQPSWNTADQPASGGRKPTEVETLDPQDPSDATTPAEPLSSSSPTLDIRPSTFNDNATEIPSNPPNPASPKPIPTPTPTTTSPPKSQILNPKSKIEPSPAARRLEHERKLEQLKEARRLGLPYHFVFDPEDGPLPPPPPQPGDYHIVMPGPY